MFLLYYHCIIKLSIYYIITTKVTVLKKSDFYFNLPENLIAQKPLEQRDSSAMMVIERKNDTIEHKNFYDITDYLKPGDLLVMNDSRVIPARLYGNKVPSGGHVEFVLIERRDMTHWEVMVRPGKRLREGAVVSFGDGKLIGKILEVLPNANRIVEFSFEGDFYNLLDSIGQMPLPHYIKAELSDNERYQTVYSNEMGSSAAPTAGLHFTDEILEKIRAMGVNTAFVTLHVGIGTFRPVKAENILEHHMHAEHYDLSDETAKLINETKKQGGRVIAVGTTSCRTLESVANKNGGNIVADSGYTDIFIYPGYEFKTVEGLLTNFHLPESTLIMLVSAFYDREKILNCYNTAVEQKYRFFSFGDCMLIL